MVRHRGNIGEEQHYVISMMNLNRDLKSSKPGLELDEPVLDLDEPGLELGEPELEPGLEVVETGTWSRRNRDLNSANRDLNSAKKRKEKKTLHVYLMYIFMYKFILIGLTLISL